MNSVIYSTIALVALGVGWFLIARSSKPVSPVVSSVFVQGIGIPMFAIFIPWADPQVSVSSIFPLIFIGVFQAFVMLALFAAMKHGDTGIVLPITDGYAIITTLLGIIFLHDNFSVMKLSGLVLITTGIILISINVTKKIALNKGVIEAVIAAIGNGIFFFLIGVVAKNSTWFVTALGVRIVITLALITIILVKKVDIRAEMKNLEWKFIISGALLDVIGFSFFNISLTVSSVSYSTLMISAQSLMIVILSYSILKEKVSNRQWIGVILALVGLVTLQIN